MNNEILDFFKDESAYFKQACDVIIGADERIVAKEDMDELLDYITNLQEEIDRLNNIIKNLDKMFEYYFLGNLKYDQDTVNTIYIKYVKLKELKENK